MGYVPGIYPYLTSHLIIFYSNNECYQRFNYLSSGNQDAMSGLIKSYNYLSSGNQDTMSGLIKS